MKNVVIQGLGFVGLAMSVAVASARDENNDNLYNVTGLDLATPEGNKKVSDINNGIFPLKSSDVLLEEYFHRCIEIGNLSATTNPEIILEADYIIVDINLDVDIKKVRGNIDFSGFSKAIETIGDYLKKESLVIIETTVPPGTTEKIVYPILEKKLNQRYSKKILPMVAHSYERVMPGPNYFNSITNFWRVFAGCNRTSAIKCKEFLRTIINIQDYELTEVMTTTASETAKIMENSYRALNIAFIDEWSKFAEIINIDLFDVISAIKVRPTHNNIMRPGLGVGGYCLTKDPLMGMISLDQIYNKKSDFPLSKMAVKINKKMPENTLNLVLENLTDINNILVLGITYLEDVGDIRFSASEKLISLLIKRKLSVDCFDPLISYSNCKEVKMLGDLPKAINYSVIILAVKHSFFKDLNFSDWLYNFSGTLIDSNNVLDGSELRDLKKQGINVKAIGRGGL
jgi:nucleotide sugar dehydrogenase